MRLQEEINQDGDGDKAIDRHDELPAQCGIAAAGDLDQLGGYPGDENSTEKSRTEARAHDQLALR